MTAALLAHGADVHAKEGKGGCGGRSLFGATVWRAYTVKALSWRSWERRSCMRTHTPSNAHFVSFHTHTRPRNNAATHAQTRTHARLALPFAGVRVPSQPAGFRLHRRRTPLHISVKYGKSDVVRLLVANGADVTARDNDGSVEYSRRRRCTVVFRDPFEAAAPLRIVG
jgi:hypothetical protein